MAPPVPQNSCPTCGQLLHDDLPHRCPECGWEVAIWDLAAPRLSNPPRFARPILLVGVAGGPIAYLVLFAGALLLGVDRPLAILFPYSSLLLLELPASANLVAIAVGLIQGPLYGLLGATCRPIRRHWGIWTVLGILHAAASAVALRT